MLIPWNTDAPIYHFPWTTLGLMVVNTAVVAVTLQTEPESIEPWILQYGNGLHPVQWITSAFIHEGFFHLIGNMLFLWAFGLVVEGKLGWWRFLLVYLGLGIVQNAAEQSLTIWFNEGGSLGASAIVFGVMAMALVWAPENEVSCILIWIHVAAFEIRILWLAILYIGQEVLWVMLTGFEVDSALFHSFGAVLRGYCLGALMLRLDWVDCEGWDLFSVLKGRAGRERDSTGHVRVRRKSVSEARASTPENSPSVNVNLDQALSNLRKLLSARKSGAAWESYQTAVARAGIWELPEKELLQLADLLCHDKLWNDAVPLLEEYQRRFQKRVLPVRLKLAQILVEEQKCPRYAQRILAEIPARELDDKYRKLRATLGQKAQQLIDDGVLELEKVAPGDDGRTGPRKTVRLTPPGCRQRARGAVQRATSASSFRRAPNSPLGFVI